MERAIACLSSDLLVSMTSATNHLTAQAAMLLTVRSSYRCQHHSLLQFCGRSQRICIVPTIITP
eukprot:6489626-Amphidinium_carterae.2